MIIKKFLSKVALVVGMLSMSLSFIYPNVTYAKIFNVEINSKSSYQMGNDETFEEAEQKTFNSVKRNAAKQAIVFFLRKVEGISDDAIDYAVTNCKIVDKKILWDREKRICTVEIVAKVSLDSDYIMSPSSLHPEIDKSKAVVFMNKKDKRTHYYQIVDWGLNWSAAKAECEKEPGRHLATIGSKEEQKFIEELLRNQGNRNCYWLGGEKVSKDKFFWIDDTPFKYKNWAKWQPDRPEEKALMIYKNTNPRAPLHVLGTWADLRADGTSPNENDFFGLDHFGFICEWDS